MYSSSKERKIQVSTQNIVRQKRVSPFHSFFPSKTQRIYQEINNYEQKKRTEKYLKPYVLLSDTEKNNG